MVYGGDGSCFGMFPDDVPQLVVAFHSATLHLASAVPALAGSIVGIGRRHRLTLLCAWFVVTILPLSAPQADSLYCSP